MALQGAASGGLLAAPPPLQAASSIGVKRALNGAPSGGAGAAAAGGGGGSLAVAQLGAPGGAGPVEDEGHSGKRMRADESLMCKNTGTSLLETFDAAQIRGHLEQLHNEAVMLKQRTAAAAAAAMALNPNPEDVCRVCRLNKLTFEPPCIYCTQCGQRIKRGQTYHCTPPEVAEIRGFWCHGCFNEHKGERVPFEGAQSGFIRKVDMQKKKNDDEVEEGWVQCDCCEGWVHQICGLFNKGRNDQTVHYLCPECLLMGLERGLRQRVEVRPQAMLEAKDLPHCQLSRRLEARVARALDTDRAARAAAAGRAAHEVPTATGLTVRVINNVTKKCEVKPKFLESFGQDGCPEAFPYRQRVVLLFQKQDGVDVALYCMYVQEYGADCAPPNRNCVYLSYIDSVKYFRPEVPAASSPSVRTLVYHEILLEYLAFVKALGYEQMFIWACPPLQGDDYILYCHPSKQKTPRSDRLRAWYHDMLRKARAEGSVVHLSTLWDTYFEGGKDFRGERASIANIPYLDGDYWPGEAENLLATIGGGGAGSGGPSGKAGGGGRKGPNKGKRYAAGATTDEQLMGRLGEVLGGNMKEDFMVVHLREPCSSCRCYVNSGLLHRYVACGHAPKPPLERRFEGIRLETGGGHAGPTGPLTHFQVCDACFAGEAARIAAGQRPRLPPGVSLTDLLPEDVHPLTPMTDPDGDIENEFFETRQAFLSLCQGNHYQFDSMRRAKHSSMMVLYHLHNPSAPAFASTCNTCSVEIEAGTGFRCTVCSDFDMCGNCHARGMPHEHPLVAHQYSQRMDETRTRLTEQERLERTQQLQKTMQLLVHACSCSNPNCGSNSCRKVRQLFAHAVQCQQKVTGGCQLCKKMWCLLNLHAKSCTAHDCPVPRCKELKELRRRQTARLEKQRRLAYSAMMRGQQMQGGGTD